MIKKLDIHYNSDNELEKKLSNLYPYTFIIDGYSIKSMEGFIQSLKTNDMNEKIKLWNMYGTDCWRYGQKFNNWKINQKVYWNNYEIERNSDIYDYLINRSYDCLYENEDFKKVIKDTIKYKLSHNIGNIDKSTSLLTINEFLNNIERLRNNYKYSRFNNILDIFI